MDNTYSNADLSGDQYPMVSVITPVFNGEAHISSFYHSLSSQVLTNFEVILVDDASTDKTNNHLQDLKTDPRVVVLTNETRLGACESRNRGTAIARGEFIAFLDIDDGWEKMKLCQQVNYMRSSGATFTYTDYAHTIGGRKVQEVTCAPSYKLVEMLRDTKICLSSVMYSRAFHGNCYFRDIAPCSEISLYMQLLARSIAKKSPGVTLYALTQGSMSANKINAARRYFSILRDQIGLSGLPLYLIFLSYALNALKRHSKSRLFPSNA